MNAECKMENGELRVIPLIGEMSAQLTKGSGARSKGTLSAPDFIV